uniref:G_PROTEIN_RECEP_F1_2 domain-containing protein n=1 Tax=Steinernema glaseri TaxID=37863 RepID=A0A1I7ZW39_9BILA
MSRPYEDFYNRVLDATAVLHIPVKLCAIVVSLRYTPRDMRVLSMFLLNQMAWNAVVNFIPFAENEVFGHVMFYVILYCLLNIALAVSSMFPYRYVAFAYPNRKLRPILIFTLYTGAILSMGAFFAPVYLRWIVSYDEYPLKEELPERSSLICFRPFGMAKNITVLAYLVVVVLVIVTIVGFSALLLRSINKKMGVIQQKILDKHKRILSALIVLASIPVVFGGLPLILAVLTVYRPHTPYASEVCMICIVVMANHSTFNDIAMLVVIQPYRRAVRNRVMKIKIPYRRAVRNRVLKMEIVRAIRKRCCTA